MTTPTQNEIGNLRQWLNEDRITDPKKMVTNEMLMTWFKDKPSDIFEGPDSSLKKAFDEATTPTNDTQLIEEFKLMFPDLWSGELKDTWVRDYVLDFFLSKIHSARKEGRMEILNKVAYKIGSIETFGTRDSTITGDQTAGRIEVIVKKSDVYDIIQSERESVNNT